MVGQWWAALGEDPPQLMSPQLPQDPPHQDHVLAELERSLTWLPL